jgi:hypothetical protein
MNLRALNLHGPQVKYDYEAILKPVAETSDESNIT